MEARGHGSGRRRRGRRLRPNGPLPRLRPLPARAGGQVAPRAAALQLRETDLVRDGGAARVSAAGRNNQLIEHSGSRIMILIRLLNIGILLY